MFGFSFKVDLAIEDLDLVEMTMYTTQVRIYCPSVALQHSSPQWNRSGTYV
jgi:hypothetical protein